jgi:predicted permease
MFRRLASIAGGMFRRRRAEAQLDEELRVYLDMAAAEKVRGGQTSEDARREAALDLGGLEQAKERVRTERHGWRLDEIGRDLRYGSRLFLRSPGFTAVVLVTLALGIGANTATFSLLDALLLRTLPVRNPQELLLVNLRGRDSLGADGETLSYNLVRALDQRTDVFVGVAGFTAGVTFDVGQPGALVRRPGGVVTGDFYRTLGLQPVAGRLLEPGDDEPGAPPVAVISDGYWAEAFQRSPDVIGRPVLMNGVPVTVVGVTPSGFDGANVGATVDITIAAAALPAVRPAMAEMLGPGNSWLRALARPAPGIRATEAAARLNVIWQTLSDSVVAPHWSVARRRAMAESVFVLEPGATGWTYLRFAYAQPLLVLQAIAGVVLLIACTNIASLLLIRGATRRRELAVRLAIGAGRSRIVRQLLIEGLMLSFAGAAIGIGVAYLLSRFLVALILTGPFQIVLKLAPNLNVLGFSVGIAVVTGVVFGLTPAFQARASRPSLVLRDDARTSTRRSKLLPALVVAQVALSLVLVAGAALFVRTLNNLQHVPLGFNPDRVFVIDLERGLGPSPLRLAEVASRVPGVAAAGVATHTPLDGSSWGEAIVPTGQPMPENDNALIIGVSAGFLRTLAIPVVAGRDISADDAAGRTAVAVVNERYAGRFFPAQNPLGHHLSSKLMGQPADLVIVGVVKDTAAAGLRRQPPPIVYVSFDQFGGKLAPTLAFRTTDQSGQAAAAVRKALQAELPAWPVSVQPLETQVAGSIVQARLLATIAGGFGALALVLSAVGLYGVLAYGVTQRTREIGIRMALGATGSGVVSLVLLNGIRLLAGGVVLGLPIVWIASRGVSSMLFGLQATDPSTMVAAVSVLATAALLASYAPARRASRLDPIIVLRHE